MSDGITNIDVDGTIQCIVAYGQYYTLVSSGSTIAYEAGMSVPVHPSEVKRLVDAGIILPPGAIYIAPPSAQPPGPVSGLTKLKLTSGLTMSTVPCTFTPGTRVIQLPSVPATPQNMYITINGFDYIGSNLSVSGSTVTMSFALQAGDVVTATYAV